MIEITLDKRSKAQVDRMLAAADARVARGEELFLLEIADVLKREVQGAAPSVPLGKGRRYKYAGALRMTGVEGMPGAEQAVAVWLPRKAVELQQQDLMRTVLILQAAGQAPEWVRVAAGAGPWPGDWLPWKLSAKQATVVVRHVRADEAQAVRDRIWAQRADLAKRLVAAGAPPFELGRGNAAGQRVYVDLAWEVLRGEFGWADGREAAVWRPAIKKMMDAVPGALRKVAAYLCDGNEGRFDVTEADTVAWRKVRTGLGLQKTLMPFVPRKVR